MQTERLLEPHIQTSSSYRPESGCIPTHVSISDELNSVLRSTGMNATGKSKRFSNASSVCSNASTVTSLSARPIYGLKSYQDETEYKKSVLMDRPRPTVGAGLDLLRTPNSPLLYSKRTTKDKVINATRSDSSCSNCHQIGEKARRKMMDLEITNTSLLAVNASLEHTIRAQAQQLVKLRKDLKKLQRGGHIEASDDVDSVLLGAETSSILSLESLESGCTRSDSVSLVSSCALDRSQSMVESPVPLEASPEDPQDEHQFGRVCNKIQGLIDMAAEAISVTSIVPNSPERGIESSEEEAHDLPETTMVALANTPAALLTSATTPKSVLSRERPKSHKKRHVIDPKLLARLESKLRSVTDFSVRRSSRDLFGEDAKTRYGLTYSSKEDQHLFKSNFVEVPSGFLKRLMDFFEGGLFSQWVASLSNNQRTPAFTDPSVKYLDDPTTYKQLKTPNPTTTPKVLLNYHEYSLINRIQPHRRRVASVPTSLFALPKVQCPEVERLEEDGSGSLYFSSVIS